MGMVTEAPRILKNPVFDLSELAGGRQAWYVIHSKPHKENQLTVYMKTCGLETFCPMLKVQPTNPRSAKYRPYFPGYVFVRADLAEIGLNTLQWMPGAVGVVQFDGQAAAVSDAIISQLKRRIEALKANLEASDNLKPGDAVRITGGPLSGYEALFDLRLNGSQRVQVLLDMLGQLVRVEVNVQNLERIKHLDTYPHLSRREYLHLGGSRRDSS